MSSQDAFHHVERRSGADLGGESSEVLHVPHQVSTSVGDVQEG